MYKVTAKVNDVGIVEVPLLPESFQIDVDSVLAKCTPNTKLMFLCSPGNPTARVLDPKDILQILDSPLFTGMVVVDEVWTLPSSRWKVTDRLAARAFAIWCHAERYTSHRARHSPRPGGWQVSALACCFPMGLSSGWQQC